MSSAAPGGQHDWVHGHPHEPNPTPADGGGHWTLVTPDGHERLFTVEDLHALPYTAVHDCHIVSTGHSASGPFTFGGVRLADLLTAVLPSGAAWRWIDVISVDGFGARLTPAEVAVPAADRPIILAYRVDGAPLSHAQGLVRLIVPSEIDDALRQVKWVSRIEIAA
jgi:DMSO/TMAO reductase YedYZ molybdopterin-dependent catalytic subunit